MITNIAGLDTQSEFRLALYTFAQKFQNIFPLNGTITAATGALALIAPDINDCSNNCPESYFDAAISGMAGTIGVSGTGASQATSQKCV